MTRAAPARLNYRMDSGVDRLCNGMTRADRHRSRGFTIAELVTVTAIIAVLAAIALPLAKFGIRRERETELHDRLQKITWAIDRYNDLRIRGQMKAAIDLEQGPYPKTLEELTKPIEMMDGKKIVLLRERDLIDPMTGRAEWYVTSSTDEGDSVESTNGDNVYDVHSKSTALSLDGKKHYNEW